MYDLVTLITKQQYSLPFHAALNDAHQLMGKNEDPGPQLHEDEPADILIAMEQSDMMRSGIDTCDVPGCDEDAEYKNNYLRICRWHRHWSEEITGMRSRHILPNLL